MRVVSQCVAAGLVDGKKIHVDACLIEANASRDSVVKGTPEWIAALKQAYQAAESKLDDTTTPKDRVGINDQMLSTTDPDAGLTRMGSGQSRPRYHHHRAVDDAHGVITAMETTSGSFADAANNHHFKRSRWRRLWRQQIQDYLIAAIQNVRILLKNRPRPSLEAGNNLQNVSRQFNTVIDCMVARMRTMMRAIAGNNLEWGFA